MRSVTTSDGVPIFYKDWGPKDAEPVVFHHGWPLSSDDWHGMPSINGDVINPTCSPFVRG